MKVCKLILLALAASFFACASKTSTTVQEQAPAPSTPFCADSAFAFVAAQTAFGPRVPGSEASRNCAQWLLSTLTRLGADTVIASHNSVTAYDGTDLNITNITARFNTHVPKRVLLLAHWDSRPWADHDPNPDMRMTPIDGANDGASGVGVILEIARILRANGDDTGLDILFVDAEDYGHREGDNMHPDSPSGWCLGTQEWLTNPTIDLPTIKYAVLLDMVGGKDAVFPHEYHSQLAAYELCARLSRAAERVGEGARFPNQTGEAVLDDHIPLLAAKVPAIDIIENANPQTGSFNPTWHTMDDNIQNIDPATLGAVGRTVYELISSH